MDNKNIVDKTVEVVKYICDNNGATFTDIKDSLDLPKATLHRILTSLESNDMISKNQATNVYSPGIMLIYLGIQAKSNISLITISENIMQQLSEETNETVNLNILYNSNVLNIFSIEGENSVLVSKLVPISSLNCSSSGKLFLSRKTDDELKSYFGSGLPEKRTVSSICSYEDFKNEQESIINQGISFDREEYEYGLLCISAPLRNHSNSIDAAISISGPITRLKMKGIDTLADTLKEKVAVINNILIKIKFESIY